MTEHPEQDLTPEQEAAVRRLLAEARHTEPIPDAVVARLDRVLSNLAAEPAREETVVRLADRRRRATTMLVAAAASVAAVIGIGAIVSTTDRSGSTDLATSSEAEDAGARAENGAENGAEGAPRGALPQTDSVTGSSLRVNGRGPRDWSLLVDSDEFASDVARLQRQTWGDAGSDSGEAAELDATVKGRVCTPGDWGGGRYVAVRYDGAEGWVVLRRPRGDTQIADLFLCGSESVIRSVTLPHP